MQLLSHRKGANPFIPQSPMSDLFDGKCANCGTKINKITAKKQVIHGHYGSNPTEKNAWYNHLYYCDSFNPDTMRCSTKEVSSLTGEKLSGQVFSRF